MDERIRSLLEGADDPEHAEYPPAFDWRVQIDRVAVLKPALDRLSGRDFVQEDDQDASFTCQLFVQRPGKLPNWIDHVIPVRFSNFGDLFTTWSLCEAERLPEAVVAALTSEIEAAGFRFVPSEALDEPYSGRHPHFAGKTWYARFFDWL